MNKTKFLLLFILFISPLQNISFANKSIETLAEYAIVIDFNTNRVLLDKNSDQIMFPASMSKLMTAYVVFSQLASKKITLEDTLRVSEKAWRKGGSKMFVEMGSRVSVEDLLKGMIVQSGNDASIVLAEGLFGSEELFSLEMNRLAKRIGMNQSNFKNATGWPDPEHVTTAKDLSLLASDLYKRFPQYMGYYSKKSYTYNNIKQGNRNPLLYKNLGSDGLKTGHTSKSGYGLVGSAVRNDRRVIAVINGLNSSKDRSQEAERLIDWSFREFNNYKIYNKNTEVYKAPIWLGTEEFVPVILNDDIKLTLSDEEYRNLKVKVKYSKPISAPIKKGKEIGFLHILVNNKQIDKRPLFSAKDIDELSLFGKVKMKLEYILFGEIIGK